MRKYIVHDYVVGFLKRPALKKLKGFQRVVSFEINAVEDLDSPRH